MPDVPGGELLVPAPPGRVRVDRRRAAPASTWWTWPAARATAPPCWRRRARAVTGVDANPEAHEHARLKYTRPGRRLRARPGGDATARSATRWSSSRRSSTWSARRRCCATSASMLRPGGAAYVSTPNLLTLAPPGAEKSDNPWHLREYRAEEFRALCESVFDRVELYGLFHARKLRVHELALRAGWDRVHAALGITKPFYDRFTPAIATSDFALRAGRPRAGARLRGRAARRDERAPRGARARAPHAHALRGGLRHVAVRRGVALGGGGLRVPAAARAARRRAR